jgi:hypothetical protein
MVHASTNNNIKKYLAFWIFETASIPQVLDAVYPTEKLSTRTEHGID